MTVSDIKGGEKNEGQNSIDHIMLYIGYILDL